MPALASVTLRYPISPPTVPIIPHKVADVARPCLSAGGDIGCTRIWPVAAILAAR